jgi:hypothetical protein
VVPYVEGEYPVDDLTPVVTNALANPSAVINRLRLYETSEKNKRHEQMGMSILRYALSGYITSVVDVPSKYALEVETYDDAVKISGVNERRPKDAWAQEIPYPLWLTAFFSDEKRFSLLTPGSTVYLSDVLDTMEAFMAQPSTAPAEEDEDDDDESDEDEWDEDDEGEDEDEDEDEEEWEDEDDEPEEQSVRR